MRRRPARRCKATAFRFRIGRYDPITSVGEDRVQEKIDNSAEELSSEQASHYGEKTPVGVAIEPGASGTGGVSLPATEPRPEITRIRIDKRAETAGGLPAV